MSERTLNLRRAATFITRLDAIPNGPHDFEGVDLRVIANDLVEAANDLVVAEATERIREMARTEFKCNVDESAGLADETFRITPGQEKTLARAGLAEVVDLHDFSRRVS